MEKWQKFFGNGWAETLEGFLSTPEFESIGKYLKDERGKGKIIAPDDRVIFRAFKECPWSRLNTVILGVEPYGGRIDEKNWLADGLAFSARGTKIPPRQLQFFQKAIDDEIYDGDGIHLGTTNDLTYLANQGVLLLNCALTFVAGNQKAGHIFLWNRFIQYVLTQIIEHKEEMVFILMGMDAHFHKPLVNKKGNAVYTCEHPTEALYRGGKWNSNGVFKCTDAFHQMMGHNKINWNERATDSNNEFKGKTNPYSLSTKFLQEY